MEMADFLFQQDFVPAYNTKTPSYWFTDHYITVLGWPANSPDLNPIANLRDIVKKTMRNIRLNNTDELKTIIKASWSSIAPGQCHRLIV